MLCLLVFGLTTLNAHAVSLSRPAILSSIGHPLVLEFDLRSISAEESVDLKIDLGTRENYAFNNIAPNEALEQAKVELLSRSDGSKYIRITGIRPVQEPYVEVLVNLKWASGSILKDYGVFIGTQSTGTDALPVNTIFSSSNSEAGNTQSLTVQAGDTAGAIALHVLNSMGKAGAAKDSQLPRVSLDQMLVALLQSNPNAFIKNNVNLVKAGARLKIPSPALANAINAETAHSEILFQAQEFSNYKATLSAHLPIRDQNLEPTNSAQKGKITGKVKEQKTANKDQLKLSPPEPTTPNASNPPASNPSLEDRVAQQKQSAENAERFNDLVKNITDLASLAQSAGLRASDGLLSGLPQLAHINSLHDLAQWFNAYGELVYALGFILCCLILLVVWLRINRASDKSVTKHETDDVHERDEWMGHFTNTGATEVSRSPVFDSLEPSAAVSNKQPQSDSGAENLASSRSASAEKINEIKFDFDLDLPSDVKNAPQSRANHDNDQEHNHKTSPASPLHSPIADEPSKLGNSLDNRDALNHAFDIDQAPSSAHTSATPSTNFTSPSVQSPPAHETFTQVPSNDQKLTKNNPSQDIEDPYQVRLDLAQELWKLGQKHTGRALAQEVADQAGEEMRAIALRWLSEHP